MQFTIPSLILLGALSAPAATLATPTPATIEDPKPIDREQTKVLKLGSTVSETLALKDFAGKTTTFKDLRDKVVIVHFWSYRCPAEIHANPIFKQMEERYADAKDVVMIGIVSNQNELGPKPAADADYAKHYTELRDKYKEVGYRHTILADHGNEVSDLFNARTTPHCYVFDQKGVLRYEGALDDDPRGDKGDEATNYVVEATTAVLAGKKLEIDQTKPYG